MKFWRASDPELNMRTFKDAPGPVGFFNIMSVIAHNSWSDHTQTPISLTIMLMLMFSVYVASTACLSISGTKIPHLWFSFQFPLFSLRVKDRGCRNCAACKFLTGNVCEFGLICHVRVFNYNSVCLTIQQFIIPLASSSISHLFTSMMYIKLGPRRWYHNVSCHTRSIPQTHFSPLSCELKLVKLAVWDKNQLLEGREGKRKPHQDPKFIAVAKIFTPPRKKAGRGSRLAWVKITGKMSRAKRDT